jgi:hypothetical protein
MLRGIFTTCKTSKDVILHNQHIIHRKLEIAAPLEEFDETAGELVDLYGSLTTKELAYFQMGEAGSSNAPHVKNNNENNVK